MLVPVMPINEMFFRAKKIFKKSIKIVFIPLSFFIVFVLLEVPGFGGCSKFCVSLNEANALRLLAAAYAARSSRTSQAAALV